MYLRFRAQVSGKIEETRQLQMKTNMEEVSHGELTAIHGERPLAVSYREDRNPCSTPRTGSPRLKTSADSPLSQVGRGRVNLTLRLYFSVSSDYRNLY